MVGGGGSSREGGGALRKKSRAPLRKCLRGRNYHLGQLQFKSPHFSSLRPRGGRRARLLHIHHAARPWSCMHVRAWVLGGLLLPTVRSFSIARFNKFDVASVRRGVPCVSPCQSEPSRAPPEPGNQINEGRLETDLYRMCAILGPPTGIISMKAASKRTCIECVPYWAHLRESNQ